MLHKITLENCFTHKNLTVNFDEGLTAITGPNGAGKSLILEMVRYALFGSSALRGVAADYKQLKVTLEFSLRGVRYKIFRSASKQELYRNDEIIAVGTSTLNEKIPQLFGYGMKVFDVANCANQDQLNALTSMTPTQRKTMVDDVIGLDIIDKLVDAIGEKARDANAKAEALEQVLHEPVKPQKPDNYMASDKLLQQQQFFQDQLKEKHTLQGFLQNAPADPGRAPEKPVAIMADNDVQVSIQEWQGELRAHGARSQRLHQLELTISQTQKPSITKDELVAYREQFQAAMAYRAASNELQEYKAPERSKELLLTSLRVHEEHEKQYNQWIRKKRLLDAGHNHCPSCGHEWAVASDDIEAEGLADVQECPPPELSATEVAQIKHMISRWNHIEENQERIAELKKVPEVEQPEVNGYKVNEADLDHQEKLIEAYAKVGEAEKEAAQLRPLVQDAPDYQAWINQLYQYQTDFDNWQRQKAQWDAFMEKKAQTELRLQDLNNVEQLLHETTQALNASTSYEKDLNRFESEQAKYIETKKEIDDLRHNATQYNLARAGVKKLKTQVKKFLVPSLSKVASALIHRMTGGHLFEVSIDEEFNIAVNGKRIETLSGSERAVTNLAVRIGLGQVLTNKQFSVFMADEIDGSMDAERAEFTATALQNLTKHISQILLVSHKYPEADHHIRLKGSSTHESTG